MATATPERRPRQPWRKRLGCLVGVAAFGLLLLYTLASLDTLPRRAFSHAHEQIRAGQPLVEVAGVLLELMKSSGTFQVYQRGSESEREVLVSSGSYTKRPSAEGLAARIDRRRPVQVWMSTVDFSGEFTIVLADDGAVREVSKVDVSVK